MRFSAIRRPEFFRSGLSYALAFALVVLIVAVCRSAATSDPVIFDWNTNSDSLTLPFLARDLSEDIGSWYGWQLSRAPYLFPDFGITYLAFQIAGNLRDSVPLSLWTMAFLQALLIIFLLRATMRESAPSATVIAVMIWFVVPTSLVIADRDLAEHIIKYQFSIGTHFSAFMLGALVIGLVINCWSKRLQHTGVPYMALAALGVLSAAGILSSKLFYLYGVAPVLAVTAHAALTRRIPKRDALLLLLTLVLAGIAATIAYGQLNRQPDLPLARSPSLLWLHFRQVAGDAVSQFRVQGTAFRLWFCSSLLYLAAVPALVARGFLGTLREPERPRPGGSPLAAWLALACWTGAVLSVAGTVAVYESVGSWRYLVGFFYFPLLHLTLYGTLTLAVGLRARSRVAGAAVGLLGLLSLGNLAVIHAYAKDLGDSVFLRYRQRAVDLEECVLREGLHTGVANYWLVRHTMYFADRTDWLQPLAPWNVGGGLFYWGTNGLSFFRLPSGAPVEYDFLVQNGYRASEIFDAYGAPSREIACKGGVTLYVYSDRDRFFERLEERNPLIYLSLVRKDARIVFPAPSLHGQVGRKTGPRRSADELLDKSGYLVFGQYVYIGKGTYQALLKYEIPDPAGQEPSGASNVFDVTIGFGATVLASAAIPRVPGKHALTLHFDVNNPDGNFEARVFFGGKGSIIVDSITIKKILGADR